MGLVLLFVSVFGSLVVLAGRRARWKITKPIASRSNQRHAEPAMSPVAQQHLHLLQGGLISQAALDATKSDFQKLLAQGRTSQVETRLRPGLDFVVQVRALAEIGTDEAGRILEHQLARKLSTDPLDQSWYWIDLAHSLRRLHRTESLPVLLDRAPQALALPLGHLFASELVCFDGFATHLDDPFSTLGRRASRVLLHTLIGLRCGVVPVSTIVEAQLGQLASRLVHDHTQTIDGLFTQIVLEVLRLARRIEHVRVLTFDDPTLSEGLHWQESQFQQCEKTCLNYLHRVVEQLPRMLLEASDEEQRDLLHAIDALRVDAGAVLLALLDDVHFVHRAEAITALAWSRDPLVRHVFVERAREMLWQERPRRWFRRHAVRPAALAEQVAAVLALRRHPSLLAEQTLLQVIIVGDAWLKPFAVAALGWWEPILREEVVTLLKRARTAGDTEVKRRARAALARLGERQALNEIQQALTDEEPQRLKQTIALVVEEGLTWFWPNLDRLADAEDAEVAYRAREGLERLREDAIGISA